MKSAACHAKSRGSELRSVVLATCVVALAVCAPVRAASPAPVVDQSFTSPGNLTAIINECCNFVAQTFTAGRDGLLAGVSIDTYDATPSEPGAPLRVSIRNTEGGLPGQTVLAETVLPAEEVPLSRLITFPQTVEVRSGVQYAIVVNLDNPPPPARAGWNGGVGDPYPRGALCIFVLDSLWTCDPPGFDVHFQTYVAGRPTSRHECKDGGWEVYGVFKNQGDCVSFVRHQARQECLFIRAAQGRPAFRAQYGRGIHKQHAMRRCIRRRMND